jgi:hypothetical protein
MCKPTGHTAFDPHPQQDTEGGTLYQTNRQAGAEAIVRILHEVTDRMDYEASLCLLCLKLEDNGHEESCPFQMADEFIAKYGTQPPTSNARSILEGGDGVTL